MIRSIGPILLGCLLATEVLAQVKLPTLDEALELSSRTGRPIFAMAGQKT